MALIIPVDSKRRRPEWTLSLEPSATTDYGSTICQGFTSPNLVTYVSSAYNQTSRVCCGGATQMHKPGAGTTVSKRVPSTAAILLAVLTLLNVLLLPSGTAFSGEGSWTAAGPADTNIGTIAVAPGDNQVLYTIGRQGLWKLDGGNWTLVNSRMAPSAPLAIDPRNAAVLYSSRSDNEGEIIKSIDSGASWTELRSGRPATALAIDPANPSIIYAGIAGGAPGVLGPSVLLRRRCPRHRHRGECACRTW